MKFDVIIGNPPYQRLVGASKTYPLWNEFVLKSFDVVEEGGWVALIHPPSWRDVNSAFKDVEVLLKSKDIKYLEIHDQLDAIKVFGVKVMWDWYVINNSPSTGNTEVMNQHGDSCILDLRDMTFIPNGMWDQVEHLLAKEGEARVFMLHDCSYHTQNPHMSKTKTIVYNKPVIYTIKLGDNPTLWYSSRTDRGHYGIPKFIWANGLCTSIGTIVDEQGIYGVSQFAYAIVDEIENLHKIKKVFDSLKFKELMKACPNNNHNINYKIVSLFRKDFWKDFID